MYGRTGSETSPPPPILNHQQPNPNRQLNTIPLLSTFFPNQTTNKPTQPTQHTVHILPPSSLFPKTNQTQAYAAEELYRREWRFHREMKLWIKEEVRAVGRVCTCVCVCCGFDRPYYKLKPRPTYLQPQTPNPNIHPVGEDGGGRALGGGAVLVLRHQPLGAAPLPADDPGQCLGHRLG